PGAVPSVGAAGGGTAPAHASSGNSAVALRCRCCHCGCACRVTQCDPGDCLRAAVSSGGFSVTAAGVGHSTGFPDLLFQQRLYCVGNGEKDTALHRYRRRHKHRLEPDLDSVTRGQRSCSQHADLVHCFSGRSDVCGPLCKRVVIAENTGSRADRLRDRSDRCWHPITWITSVSTKSSLTEKHGLEVCCSDIVVDNRRSNLP